MKNAKNERVAACKTSKTLCALNSLGHNCIWWVYSLRVTASAILIFFSLLSTVSCLCNTFRYLPGCTFNADYCNMRVSGGCLQTTRRRFEFRRNCKVQAKDIAVCVVGISLMARKISKSKQSLCENILDCCIRHKSKDEWFYVMVSVDSPNRVTFIAVGQPGFIVPAIYCFSKVRL